MPEAPVDEDDDLLPGEDEISPAAKRGIRSEVDSIAVPECMQSFSDKHLNARVPPTLSLHAAACGSVERNRHGQLIAATWASSAS